MGEFVDPICGWICSILVECGRICFEGGWLDHQQFRQYSRLVCLLLASGLFVTRGHHPAHPPNKLSTTTKRIQSRKYCHFFGANFHSCPPFSVLSVMMFDLNSCNLPISIFEDGSIIESMQFLFLLCLFFFMFNYVYPAAFISMLDFQRTGTHSKTSYSDWEVGITWTRQLEPLGFLILNTVFQFHK